MQQSLLLQESIKAQGWLCSFKGCDMQFKSNYISTLSVVKKGEKDDGKTEK